MSSLELDNNVLECRSEDCCETSVREDGIVSFTCGYCCATLGVCND